MISPPLFRSATRVVVPPSVEKQKGKKVKLIVQLNVSGEDENLITVLANPLSIISRKIQILIKDIQRAREIPGSTTFFELTTELQVNNALQQRLLTKFVLQENSGILANKMQVYLQRYQDCQILGYLNNLGKK